jgi:hypothetical protein
MRGRWPRGRFRAPAAHDDRLGEPVALQHRCLAQRLERLAAQPDGDAFADGAARGSAAAHHRRPRTGFRPVAPTSPRRPTTAVGFLMRPLIGSVPGWVAVAALLLLGFAFVGGAIWTCGDRRVAGWRRTTRFPRSCFSISLSSPAPSAPTSTSWAATSTSVARHFGARSSTGTTAPRSWSSALAGTPGDDQGDPAGLLGRGDFARVAPPVRPATRAAAAARGSRRVPPPHLHPPPVHTKPIPSRRPSRPSRMARPRQGWRRPKDRPDPFDRLRPAPTAQGVPVQLARRSAFAKMFKGRRVAVVVPAFNEAGKIARTAALDSRFRGPGHRRRRCQRGRDRPHRPAQPAPGSRRASPRTQPRRGGGHRHRVRGGFRGGRGCVGGDGG